MEAGSSKAPGDELLYSRQIHALGRDAMQAITASSVVIVGAKGVGAEIAKNVLLAGVKQVTIIDGGVVGPSDLSAHFLLREGDVGLDRAAISASRLAELNEDAQVQAVQGPLTAELLESTKPSDGAHVVVATQGSWDELVALDALCRSRGTHFIAAGIQGLASFVFVDLGESFEVKDTTGEPSPTVMVESITQDFPATVTVVEEQRHGFEDGDSATFSGIKGMTQLNDGHPRKVTVTGSHSFTIPDDTREYGRYNSGGYIRRVRPSKYLHFKSLGESLKAPTFIESDPSKVGRPELLHAAFQAFQASQEALGADSGPSISPELVEEIARSVQTLRDRQTSSKLANSSIPAPKSQTPRTSPAETQTLLQTLAAGWGQELAPMASIIGGVVGQEILKGMSGVMTPIQQWMYLDAFEAAPEEGGLTMETAVEARYAAQIGVFGQEVQDALSELRYLVAGAGGLGCELLKNFALMGVGSGDGGAISIADPDVVEIPNLPGQSLFRRKDLGKSKAAVAAEAVTQINASVKTEAIQEKLAAETEGLFNSAFFEKLSGVCTAVDDSASRLYIDGRCVAFGKPMVDGGKLGTKGSVQVFVPHQSEMYASTRDPSEHREFQICTLKNFPYLTEHTLQWALDIFEGLFKVRPTDVNAYLSKRDFLDNLKKNAAGRLPTLESLRDALVTQRPLGLEACVAWARNEFEDLFSNSIKQLTFNFAPGMLTSAGAPFWSGTKRAPTPLAFNVLDSLHLDFIVAAANLQASVYGLKGCRDRALFAEAVTRVEVPNFEPREGVKIAVSDEAARGSASQPGSALAMSGGPTQEADATCERLLSEMPTPASLAGYRLNIIDYQKDDLDRYHLEFVTAAANLRARNYGIPPVDQLTARLIAGRILPSVITSASVVAGLMCLELYKLVQNKPLGAYRHRYLNLALPMMAFAQPLEAVKTEVQTTHGKPLVWTLWDRFEVDGRGVLTLAQFLKDFKAKEGLEVSMLSYGRSLLYAEFLPKKKMADRLSTTLVDLVKQVAKAKVLDTETRLSFSISCSDANDDDVEVPDVIVRIR